MTSFVGRRQATLELKQALSGSRLVTLTGVGGVGKSRLALHVARELRRVFPDGVHLVKLATAQDPSLVPEAVAAALGLHDHSMRTPETVLVDYLATKQMLLLLDNCEHLLGACARLAVTLLTAAPGLRVLATSREPLGFLGEHLYPVPALSVPPPNWPDLPGSPGEIPFSQYEALTLFGQRAAAMAPDFTLGPGDEAAVARLCQRLDGVPLAIELAVARLRVLTVEQILARLDDRFSLLTTGYRDALPHHQTLRAAIGWSFDLCTKEERLLWARCSVFAGGFDLDSAENVCTDETLTSDDILTAVTGLIDKSIVSRTEDTSDTRYRMLETIRQYGREQLAESGDESALHRRHRDHYLRMAEQCDNESSGPRQAYWVQRMRVERPDLWAALDYCLTTPGEARTGLKMAAALWFSWNVCGFLREGRHWLDRALALDTAPSRERTRALWLNGWIAHLHGDHAGSLALLNESRELARQRNDETELTYAIQFLGDTENWHGNLARALPLVDEALARHRASGQWNAIALQVFPLRIHTAHLLGDAGCAMALLDECQALCAPLGERWTLSWAEWSVAVALWAAGDLVKTSEHLYQSLRKKEELDDGPGISCCVSMLACVASADGDARRAATLFGAAGKMWELIGRPLFGIETLLDWTRQNEARSREALGDQAFEAARRQGERMAQDEVIAYALGEKASPPASPSAAVSASTPVLTKRQLEVAALVASGMSNREVAASLVISQRTAETHVENILTKLGFTSRTQIAAWHAELCP